MDAQTIAAHGPWPCDSAHVSIKCQKPCEGDGCHVPAIVPPPPLPPSPPTSHRSRGGQCRHKNNNEPLKNVYCSRTQTICETKCRGRWDISSSAHTPSPPPPLKEQRGKCCHAGPATSCLAFLNQNCDSHNSGAEDSANGCLTCALQHEDCTEDQIQKWCGAGGSAGCNQLKNSFCSSSEARCESKCNGKWDPHVVGGPPSSPQHETGRACFDGKDNDGDGNSDCDDKDCLSDPRIAQRCQMAGGGGGGH